MPGPNARPRRPLIPVLTAAAVLAAGLLGARLWLSRPRAMSERELAAWLPYVTAQAAVRPLDHCVFQETGQVGETAVSLYRPDGLEGYLYRCMTIDEVAVIDGGEDVHISYRAGDGMEVRTTLSPGGALVQGAVYDPDRDVCYEILSPDAGRRLPRFRQGGGTFGAPQT